MSGIPEIFGESQACARGGAARRKEASRKNNTSVRAFIARMVRDHGGTSTSPLRLRLIDFSGEGERAPPEVSRPGQAGGAKRRREQNNVTPVTPRMQNVRTSNREIVHKNRGH
jgi:hypothetical protein